MLSQIPYEIEVSELCSRSPRKIVFIRFNTITAGFSEGIIGLAQFILEPIIQSDINGKGVGSGGGGN